MDSPFSAQALRLTELPEEILLLIVEQVKEIPDLRSLTRVSQKLFRFATPLIYRSVLITKGETAHSLASVFLSHPDHARMIEDLLISCPFERWKGLEEFQAFFPKMSKLQHLRLETPDCNLKRRDERVNWRRIQDAYEAVFQQCSHRTQPLLSSLRSATIHFVDHTESRYSLKQYTGLLLHPTLENLSLSCALLSSELASVLEGKAGTTTLKSLILEQCDFNPAALNAVLKLPRNLETLHLSENFNGPSWDGAPLPAQYVNCLRNQMHSLRDLTLLFSLPETVHAPSDPYYRFDLSKFQQLKRFQFGYIPFYPYLQNHELQTSYYQTSVARLDAVDFPPNLESFTYDAMTTHDFENHIQALKPLAPGKLRSLRMTLPLNSHQCLTYTLLEQLSRPSLYFLRHNVRFQVYDSDKRHGFIPPYLYGETPPLQWLIVDNNGISDITSRTATSISAGSASGQVHQRTVDPVDVPEEVAIWRSAVTQDAWVSANQKRNDPILQVAQLLQPNGLVMTQNGTVQMIFNDINGFDEDDEDDEDWSTSAATTGVPVEALIDADLNSNGSDGQYANGGNTNHEHNTPPNNAGNMYYQYAEELEIDNDDDSDSDWEP